MQCLCILKLGGERGPPAEGARDGGRDPSELEEDETFPALLSRKAFSGLPYISPFKYYAFNKHFAITHARKPLQVFLLLPKSVGCLKKARQYFWSAQSYLSPYFQALFPPICLDLQKGPFSDQTSKPSIPHLSRHLHYCSPIAKGRRGIKKKKQSVATSLLFPNVVDCHFSPPQPCIPFHMQISHPSSSPSPSLPCTF